VDGAYVSADFFKTLGVPAMIGRTFTPADDEPGGSPSGAVAVISYNFWQRRFAGSPDAVGAPLTIERIAYTIVGVTQAGFLVPRLAGRSTSPCRSAPNR